MKSWESGLNSIYWCQLLLCNVYFITIL